MRILYLHQYFRKPEQGGALRSYYLAKALAEAGHEVELLTAYDGTTYKKELVNGIQVHYLPVAYNNAFGPAQRIAAFLKFTFRAIWVAWRLKNIDLCYATSTPLTVGLIALLLRKFRNIPFYFEVRDLWPEAPIQLGYIKNKQVQKSLYALERIIYRQAEKVIALSPGMVQSILPHKPAWAVTLIPNLADCDFYQPAAPRHSDYHDPFYVGYFGAIGKANHLDFLLDIAQSCLRANLSQVKFIIAGEGAELPRLKARAQKEKLGNITWVGQLNREQVREYLTAVQATYTSFQVHPILQTNSPNKFFDSLAAGKLTIVNTKGWLQELVEEHKCGFYADPTDPAAFIRHLQPYLEHPDFLQHAQAHARELAESQFSRTHLSCQFVNLINGFRPR